MTHSVKWIGGIVAVLVGLMPWPDAVRDSPPAPAAPRAAAPAPGPTPKAADTADDAPVPEPRADDEYQHCLDQVRDDPAAGNAQADAWEATGGGEPALHCHALAQVALGHNQVGASMLQQIAAASRAPAAARARLYAEATQALLIIGDNAGAYGAATLALALAPRDPGLLTDRSIASGAMGKYADAIDDLTAALAINPRRADALTLRASAYRHEGRLREAQADIGAALAIDPDNPDTYLERGIVRQRAGDRDGARADWSQVLVLAPDSPAADLARQNLALLDAGPGR